MIVGDRINKNSYEPSFRILSFLPLDSSVHRIKAASNFALRLLHYELTSCECAYECTWYKDLEHTVSLLNNLSKEALSRPVAPVAINACSDSQTQEAHARATGSSQVPRENGEFSNATKVVNQCSGVFCFSSIYDILHWPIQ